MKMNTDFKSSYKTHDGKVSDKWAIYIDVYDHLLNEYKDKVLNYLEIGIQNGGSLEIMAKYFSQPQHIIGCDINPDCSSLVFSNPVIQVVVGDANSDQIQERILDIAGNFDVIVDDGSHTSSDIIKSFFRYFPFLNDDGIYIVEDLHCSYWKEFDGGLYDPFSSISFFKRLVDLINYQHWGVNQDIALPLLGFLKKYSITIDKHMFSCIHSVEFINSMCVIRKKPAEKNLLGKRVIVGINEHVVKGHQDMAGSDPGVPEQQDNNWSTLLAPPDQDYLALKNENAELMRLVDSYVNSTSWKITEPLRFVADKLIRLIGMSKKTYRILKLYPLSAIVRKLLIITRREGVRGLINRIFRQGFVAYIKVGDKFFQRNDYAGWISVFGRLDDSVRLSMRKKISVLRDRPKISIIMPVFNPPIKFLEEAIESIRNQIYQDWELCIADDASTDSGVRQLLEKYLDVDSRIKVAFRKNNGHISAASNTALELATGKYIALVDNDDLLAEDALYHVVEAINVNPDAALFYSDEDKLSDQGERIDPYFKSDWNPALFLGHNLITHLGVYKTDIVRKIGGFRIGYEGAQDYDLAARFIDEIKPEQIIHIPKILYHWRILPGSTAMSIDGKPYAVTAGEKSVSDHLKRRGVSARVESVGYGHRIQYQLPSVLPKVSIIIPTRNAGTLVKNCINSIYQKTTYQNFEVILVDNNSDDRQSISIFHDLENKYSTLRIIRDENPFNYSAINNRAVQLVNGDYVLLLNNDIEVLTPGWLDEMVGIAIQPDTGAVGARLLYPDKTIQHAGIILGIAGWAGHAHKGYPDTSLGYVARLGLMQEFSAITGACLLVSRDKYLQVGGLNETELKIACNDVDFCLKLKSAGYRNIWTPHASLFHHESATRGHDNTPEKKQRFEQEVAYMWMHWPALMQKDPAYNPNLTLDFEDFSYAWPPR